MIDAARETFVEHGYAATTIKTIAQRSGLSQESLYKTFGGKAGLLKAAYDTALAGDDQPVPMAMRTHALAIRDATTPESAAIAWADMVITVGDRIGPLLDAVLAAGATDPAAAELLQTMDDERLAGARMVAQHWASAGWLSPAAEPDEHARTLWILNSPDVRRLTAGAGRAPEEYRRWLVHMVRSSVLATEKSGD
ncbi:TetR/AcrR family transcriptional regulator [Phycicoccus sp. MAQZ13P-2]|uniref:TetR/AcrR family transcriptional regulator n=1 Tax=Phycicoccus mangrovi TaxID=2840470 RepID=UPI001C0026D1|nr:TetR/AcrR family transcriptional regulator [Phycicoccus mangrovi]MBT9257703.1 TetR/AcrR family transcriptional regulator [Phycicoccus mangrovi]MBT9273651.1 TetR/AcrR family transcriptional regulator [Phycicoccus mangrovi]